MSEDARPTLKEATEELKDTHLTCRDLGHAWKQVSVAPGGSGLYVRILRCRSCRTTRKDRITKNGVIYGRNYEYAKGYQLTGYGNEVRNRSTFRRAVLKRAGVLG